MIDLIDKNVGILGNSFLSTFFYNFAISGEIVKSSSLCESSILLFTILSCDALVSNFGIFKTIL
ncbi:hypothetical protein NBRC116602_06890 [Hyphomicrobiales bacterium 4NK60-0047b]